MRVRDLTDFIREDLARKMVFVGGPRQVGKTTLAKLLAEENPRHLILTGTIRSIRSALPARNGLRIPNFLSLTKFINTISGKI